MKKLLALISLFVFNEAAKAQTPSFMTDSLDSYVQRGLKDWDIPGLAVVVVKDGKVVVMKGYGTKQKGKNDPVDENTLFMIASNSKLFTGTALAKLDFEKKLSLDDRIKKYFPWFKLYNDTISNLVTIRDMLSHRIGTKTFQGDFTFWNSALPSRDVMMRMRELKPPGTFRQNYGYCNSCFLTAGEVIKVVTDTSWADYITTYFLKPLGMNNSYALSADFEKRNNIALPYTNTFGPLAQVPFDRIDNMAPAGSMISSVKDISRWLLMQLDSGRIDGKRIIHWPVIRATRDVNIVTNSRKSTAFPTHINGYGLGVYMTVYNGRAVYSHTGGADGYVTNTVFIPEEKLGIAVFTNNDNQSFFEALKFQIMDAYLGVPYTDRSALYLKGQRRADQDTRDTIAKHRSIVALKKASPVPMKNFVGRYSNPIYGSMTVSASGNGLLARFQHHPDLTAKLEYMDGDHFLLTWSHAGYGVFPARFVADNGKVKYITVKVNDFLEYDPYVFVKE
jgi:CubicO group peptidase (beta-lactamase class C family)